jgi:hypothetical protein
MARHSGLRGRLDRLTKMNPASYGGVAFRFDDGRVQHRGLFYSDVAKLPACVGRSGYLLVQAHVTLADWEAGVGILSTKGEL